MGVAHLSSTQHIMGKFPTFQNLWHDQMVVKQKNSKVFSSYVRMKAMHICQYDLANMVHLFEFFHKINIW